MERWSTPPGKETNYIYKCGKRILFSISMEIAMGKGGGGGGSNLKLKKRDRDDKWTILIQTAHGRI
jgi:hypothetical protein